jgi:hypothetical protein
LFDFLLVAAAEDLLATLQGDVGQIGETGDDGGEVGRGAGDVVEVADANPDGQAQVGEAETVRVDESRAGGSGLGIGVDVVGIAHSLDQA